MVLAAQGLVGNGVSCSGINQEWCQLLRDESGVVSAAQG